MNFHRSIREKELSLWDMGGMGCGIWEKGVRFAPIRHAPAFAPYTTGRGVTRFFWGVGGQFSIAPFFTRLSHTPILLTMSTADLVGSLYPLGLLRERYIYLCVHLFDAGSECSGARRRVGIYATRCSRLYPPHP